MSINHEARNRLKKAIYDRFPFCALSGRRTNLLDMHEWLVKRSDLPIIRLQDKIYSPYNCILLSRKQHSRSDGVRRDWECARWAISEYGYFNISDWLDSLNLKTFGTFEAWLNRIEYKAKVLEGESLIDKNIQDQSSD